MFNFTSLPPLTLYIHFPWCVQKCPYCDFNSHELKTSLDETRYINALISDLEQELPLFWGRSISSIFMGGGTPSLFSPESIDQLLSALRARISFAPDIEITMEANPGTIELGKFKEFSAAGINRLSIGIQSFSDDKLKSLGRIHGRKEAIRAAELAHDANFNSFNIDLMYGLPNQSLAQAVEDIETAIALEPKHLSHYQLTIEPNTYFHHQPPTVPNDDKLWDMQNACQARLAKHNYQQYEISAYAKEGFQCQHNLNYWQFGDYLGIGAGAHGKLTNAPEQQITRSWKVKQPQDYLKNAATDKRISGQKILTRDDATFEFMMNALRLNHGFETVLFQQHVGLPISTVEISLKQAEKNGWINWDINRIQPTNAGLQYLNTLLELFIPD
ncbi:MAG: radical SAM family heme chaperone HemW [Gammaproteobacteria bacterium]|nr:radical SAM family heme chaperone HemW [Gammaproteobacteria bacterium]MDH5660843.1 radical SAM family heme chaperone HemW [Gammaproteobacteria bacterium]